MILHSLKEFFLIPVQFFQNATKLHYAAIGAGLLIAFIYFRIFFRDVSGFSEDADKSGKIPIVHRDYDYVESKWSSQKIGIWILLSVASGILAYHQLPDWFPQWFAR